MLTNDNERFTQYERLHCHAFRPFRLFVVYRCSFANNGIEMFCNAFRRHNMTFTCFPFEMSYLQPSWKPYFKLRKRYKILKEHELTILKAILLVLNLIVPPIALASLPKKIDI